MTACGLVTLREMLSDAGAMQQYGDEEAQMAGSKM